MKYLFIILTIIITGCGSGDETTANEPIEQPVAPSDDVGDDETSIPDLVTEEEAVEEDEIELVEWVDPVTSRKWLRGEMVDAINAVCDVGYEIPDVNDLGEANQNGLAAELASLDYDTLAWAKNINNGLVQSWRDIADPTQWANVATGARLWCVETN